MDIAAIISAVSSSDSIATILFALGILITLRFVDFIIRKEEKKRDKQERIKELFEEEVKREQVKEKATKKREHANNVMQDLLNTTLATLMGDRLQVIEFTNTITTVAMLPYRYMTCTYESMAPGKKPMASTIKDELATLYSDFLTALRLKSYVVLNAEKRSDKFTPAIYDLIGKRFANQSLYVSIDDRKTKEPIGILSYDTSNPSGFCDKEITTLRGLAAQLSLLLTMWEEL